MKKTIKFLPISIIMMIGLFGCGKDNDVIPKSDEKEILSFKINGEDGKITFGDTVDFLFPEGTDITNLTPQIVISDKATITPASGVVQDFSGDDYIWYKVTAEDGTSKNYRVRVKIDRITYRLADFYPDPKDPSTAVGIVFRVTTADGVHGKAVSIDEISGIAWSTENVTTGCNSDDGKENTDNIKNNRNLNNYPAFKWCTDKGEGWYLPSDMELSQQLYNPQIVRDFVNAKLREIGASELLGSGSYTSNFYWSSNESEFSQVQSVYSALGVYSNGSYTIHRNKIRTGSEPGSPGIPFVRAVMAF